MTSDKVSQHSVHRWNNTQSAPSCPASMMFQNILSQSDIPTVLVHLFSSLLITH